MRNGIGGGSINGGISKCFVMENPIKMDDLGTPIYGNPKLGM